MPREADHSTPRIAPAALAALTPDQRAFIDGAQHLMGFAPNDALTMARIPGLLEASAGLVQAVFSGQLDPVIRRLVALMCSDAEGCRYCKGHTRHGALREGLDPERLADLWSYEPASVFTEAERAALRVAHHAALTPNQVEDHHFAALEPHFSESERLEIVAVIALFGFLNRWNDTMKTTLEPEPESVLAHHTPEAP